MLQKIIATVRKETIIRFSGKTELLFFLVLPIIFTTMLGGFMASDPDADNRIPLLVIDQDGSVQATRLLAALEQSDAVRPVLKAQSEAEAAFADRQAPALLRIPPGFGEQIVRGESADLQIEEQPGNTSADAAVRAVLQAISTIGRTFSAARMATEEADLLQPFPDTATRARYYSESLSMADTLDSDTQQHITITRFDTPTGGSLYDPAPQASAGQLITWVFIPLLATSAVFAGERERGTLRRLFTTPTTRAGALLGVIAANYLTGLVQMALLILFGVFVMGVNWGNSLPALTLLLMTFALAAVSLGVMLATFVKTSSQANNLSIMLGMGMALLGGCWWPFELFPAAVQQVVRILPTTWAMDGMLALVLRNAGVAAILPHIGVLLGFALLFFVIGIRRFRFE
jgi:ABC-2 type transport system permease protein